MCLWFFWFFFFFLFFFFCFFCFFVFCFVFPLTYLGSSHLRNLSVKRSLLGDRRDSWGCIEALEKSFPLSATAINNIRNMSAIKTQNGKVRAWLRLSLMEKRLAEYFRAMVDNRAVLMYVVI